MPPIVFGLQVWMVAVAPSRLHTRNQRTRYLVQRDLRAAQGDGSRSLRGQARNPLETTPLVHEMYLRMSAKPTLAFEPQIYYTVQRICTRGEALIQLLDALASVEESCGQTGDVLQIEQWPLAQRTSPGRVRPMATRAT